jgi:8-oxo-dGTP pyrophosphatase MutT (NUDIX family)
MDNQRNDWKILSQNLVYENPWISVHHFDVVNPSGNVGIYGKVHFKNLAIGIVALDNVGFIHLVGQFRFVLQQYSIEIPEGGGQFGVDPLDSAKRELREETGIQAENWEVLQEMHLSNSVTDEKAIVYLATGLSQGVSEPEDSENIQHFKISFEEAYKKVVEGEITDAITVAAILKIKLLKIEGKIP